MKRNRNAFFQSNNSSSYIYPGNNMMGMPYGTESSSAYYQGPLMPVNQNDYMADLDSRIQKLERQFNKLDSRLSKIESELSISNSSYNSNNMYMM